MDREVTKNAKLAKIAKKILVVPEPERKV